MSWVTIIWSMDASACLTLAAIYFLVWCQKRTARAYLLFFMTSAAAAAYAGCELWLMRAETPAQFAAVLRWGHVPMWVIILSLVGFVRFHLRAGRPWLAWTVCALRTLALLLNFLVGQNLNYLEVTALRSVTFLGESVSVAVGVSNPCMLVGQLSLLLLVIFTADAAITVWRRGDRRQALVTGGSIVFFSLAGSAEAVLVLWQIVGWPLTASFFYLGIVMSMGYEIGREALRAAQLFDDLRESEARMTLAAEAAGFGVWLWSIPSNQVWGSERWLRMFEFSPDAAVSLEMVMERIHPDNREMVEREVRRALADGGDFAVEYRVILPDGAQHWISARGRIFPDAPGKPARMLGAVIDITRRKQAEQEIERQRNELAHVTRVSTTGQLASSLAHELNQPLGAILRNAEAGEVILLDPSPDLDELRAILADIRQDDQRAGAVIDRMRDLMKQRKAEHRRLDLNLLVGDVIILVRPDAERRQVLLALETTPPLPVVHGDRVQLQQVMLNLLLNAMDALEDNPPPRRLVTVRARPVGATVEVTVSDTGHGIPADKLLRVFEPFYTSKPNGLGMGLAISRGIIEAHGGRLWAGNNEAGGATFTITLPMAEGVDAK
jgi:two-component system, LuxR family, sensor kinase FixL